MVSVSNVPIHIAVGVSTLLVSIYAAAEFIGQLGAVFFLKIPFCRNSINSIYDYRFYAIIENYQYQ